MVRCYRRVCRFTGGSGRIAGYSDITPQPQIIRHFAPQDDDLGGRRCPELEIYLAAASPHAQAQLSIVLAQKLSIGAQFAVLHFKRLAQLGFADNYQPPAHNPE